MSKIPQHGRPARRANGEEGSRGKTDKDSLRTEQTEKTRNRLGRGRRQWVESGWRDAEGKNRKRQTEEEKRGRWWLKAERDKQARRGKI